MGLVYTQKSSSLIELNTHDTSFEEDASKEQVRLEKELKAIIEVTDIDRVNDAELQDEDDSFMQDKYENKDGDGMTQDVEDGLTQDEEDASSRDDSKLITSQGCARKYYKLFRRYYYLFYRTRKYYIYYYRRYRSYYLHYRRYCYLLGVGELRPAGHMRPAVSFCEARTRLCTTVFNLCGRVHYLIE